jgi:hypothetical protein
VDRFLLDREAAAAQQKMLLARDTKQQMYMHVSPKIFPFQAFMFAFSNVR